MGFYEAVEPLCEPGGRYGEKARGVNVRGLQNKSNQRSVYYLIRFITRLTVTQFMASTTQQVEYFQMYSFYPSYSSQNPCLHAVLITEDKC